jgi:hypothetical protein
MATNFYSVFQTRVSSTCSLVEMTTVQLEDAFSNVATAQEPVIESRVNTLVSKIVKDVQLWIEPTVAMLDGKAHLVSGRHRYTAIDQICATYVLTDSGKLILRDKLAEGASYTEILPTIKVNVLTVNSTADLAHLQMAYNGSRSMTTAEKLLVEAAYAKPSALNRVKMSFARRLQADIGCTYQTGLAMATACSAVLKGVFVYATEDQLEELAGHISEWMGSFPDAVPGNMAREYRVVIDGTFAMLVDYPNEDGEVEEITLADYYRQEMRKPVKTAKQSSQSQIEALKAEIARLTALAGAV